MGGYCVEIFWGAEGKGFSRRAWGVGMRDVKRIADMIERYMYVRQTEFLVEV
jgi:hypothetical protein